jgi:hypothetical protein
MTREDELAGRGWVRRFVACEPRLSESVELYQSLGFEVHLEPLPDNPGPDACGEECRICFESDKDRYRIIYTRKKEGDGEGSHNQDS